MSKVGKLGEAGAFLGNIVASIFGVPALPALTPPDVAGRICGPAELFGRLNGSKSIGCSKLSLGLKLDFLLLVDILSLSSRALPTSLDPLLSCDSCETPDMDDMVLSCRLATLGIGGKIGGCKLTVLFLCAGTRFTIMPSLVFGLPA